MPAENQKQNPHAPQEAAVGALSQAIGSLMKTIEQNAGPSPQTPTSSPKNSEITTAPAGPFLKIGMPDSTLGLPTLRNLAKGTTATPAEIDTALQALLRQVCGSQLVLRERSDSQFNLVGYTISLGGIPSDELSTAVMHFVQPAMMSDVTVEITRMRTLTARRAEGEIDTEMLIGAMTEELAGYPIDIVRTACREWPRDNKFFPTLKELRDACERNFIFRRALRNLFSSPTAILSITGKVRGS